MKNRLALALPFASALNFSVLRGLFPDWLAHVGFSPFRVFLDAHLQAITFDSVCISMPLEYGPYASCPKHCIGRTQLQSLGFLLRVESVLFSRFSRSPCCGLSLAWSPLFDRPVIKYDASSGGLMTQSTIFTDSILSGSLPTQTIRQRERNQAIIIIHSAGSRLSFISPGNGGGWGGEGVMLPEFLFTRNSVPWSVRELPEKTFASYFLPLHCLAPFHPVLPPPLPTSLPWPC